METKFVEFEKDGKECSGNMTFFNQKDIDNIKEIYFKWKELNHLYHLYEVRRANVPELITECLTSAVFGWGRVNNVRLQGLSKSSMDLIDVTTGEAIQLKACSTDKGKIAGPTSFGPDSYFDKLVFMHIDCEKDEAKWYVFENENYKTWKVNKNETVAEQQKAGKRPRLNLLKKVEENQIKPIATFSFSS